MPFFKKFRSNKNNSKKKNISATRFNSTRSLDNNSTRSSQNSVKVYRKQIEEDTCSLGSLQRSETFTIEEDEVTEQPYKSSLKDIMFEKFNTFTRKKKTTQDDWKRTSTPDDENYDSAHSETDPFDVLYKQPMKNSATDFNSATTSIDYGTYKKSKATGYIKQQLEDLKNRPDIIAEMDNEEDKYKTVTLNSFRKSFRDRFLNQEKENPSYNPSWFVEVEPEQSNQNDKNEGDYRPDVLVFENDNYRPSSISPLRDRGSPVRSPSRDMTPRNTPTRSATIHDSGSREGTPQRGRTNIKRHETFKIERPEQPSIRIEIKNSITPNEPGRIVPVGVAKPFNSLGKTFIPNSTVPISNTTSGYQTCIQITSDDKPKQTQNVWVKSNTPVAAPRSTLQTNRIQISSSLGYNMPRNDVSKKPTSITTASKPKPQIQMRTYFGGSRTANQLEKTDSASNRKRWTLPARTPSNANLYPAPKPKTSFTGYFTKKWGGSKDPPNYTKPTSSKLIGSQLNLRTTSKSPIKIPWR